jgi:hypothetical protein
MKTLLPLVLFVLLSSTLYGQTGPGGVGSKDGSATQPQNVLWLKANAGVSTTGADVDTWSDQSGNLNHATGAGATRPTYTASFANLNNQPVLNFPNTASTVFSLRIPDADNLDNTSSLSVFYVIRPSRVGADLGVIAKRTASATQQSYVYTLRSGQNRLRVQIGNGTIHDAGNIAVNTNYISADVFSGTSSAPYLNGTAQTATGGNVAIPNNASDVYIGGDNVFDNFEGQLGEVVIYRTALNLAQRQIVENYLASKYGITLAAGDVYAGDAAGTDYDSDVIGFGQQSGLSHTEAQAAGLVMAAANGTLANGEFLMAGHKSATNGTSTANLGTGIQQRWLRTWNIDKTGTLDATISFDFSDGVGGNFPQSKDNYVLLRLTAGNYEEVTNITSANKTILGDRIMFTVANADLTDGVYTLGTKNSVSSPVGGVSNRTWYSYQSGNWTDPLTWTLDGGVFPLYVNPSNEVPGISDNVIITSGRTVTANTNNLTTNTAQVDGTLDLASTTGHNFLTISGIGKIRLSGATDNFPSGDATLFADALTGGTVELYGTGMSLSTARTFNDLEVNMNTTATTAILLNTMTLNGDLEILNGILRFNDNSSTVSKTFTVAGDVTVESTGGIQVGTANARHEFNLYGDFTNDGTVAFTNRVTANTGAEATDGIVDVNFVSTSQDQIVSLNGTTNFYRIEVSKGVDDTYKVSLSASATSNFNLYGYANETHAATAQLATNANALGLLYGTVEIGSNILIPVLSSTGNYNISAGAQLWINGGTVNKNAGQALVPYGKLRLTSGTLTTQVNSGITTRDNGQIIIEGGTLLSNQIRTSILGVGNVGGYAQSGGDVIINGDGPGGYATDYYIFSLTYPGNTFYMSGGTLTVKGAQTGTGGLRGAVLINCDPANVNVTGGTMIFEISNGNMYKVTSRVPFYDVIMRKTAGAATTIQLNDGTADNLGTTVAIQPLEVLNDLTIEGNVTFLTNSADVTVGGSFEVQNTATYTPGTNTTTMNGAGVSTITFGNTSSTQVLNNLTINKTAGTDNVVVAGGAATAIRTSGALRIERGDFDYGAFIVSARGSVYVADTVGASASTGRLLLDGVSAQILTSSLGRIYNLDINNTNGVTLSEDLSVLGTLTLSAGVFNIATYKLTMAGASASIAGSGFGATKMIQTAGNASDGGLELYFNANETIVYPIGTNANSSVRYTPASAAVQGFADDGYIQISLEDAILATTNPAGGANVLSYNWRVRYSSFTTRPTISYQFTYDNADIGGSEASYVPGKVLGVSPFTRSSEASSDAISASNLLVFNGSSTGGTFPGAGFTLEQASYTAGVTGRFTGTPRVFYTKTYNADAWSIDWRTTSYWTFAPNDLNSNGTVDSYEWHDSRQPTASDYPQAGDIAVIGWVPWTDPVTADRGKPHGISINRTEIMAELRFTQMLDNAGNPTARVYASNFQFRPTVVINNNEIAGNVGVLADGIVSGEGAFWIRSTGGNLSDPTFNSVDLGSFNAEDSSYFIYESTLNTANYANTPSTFPNLLMATDGWGANDRSSTIAKNITVNGDLELLGDINFVLSTGATGNVTVMRNLRFFRSNARGNDSGGGGELRFGNTGTARTVTVFGDLLLGNGYAAIAYVNTPGTTPLTHTFNLYGDFTQNTTAGNGFKGGTSSTNDRIHMNLLGSASMTLTSTAGDAPQFYSLTVNKGSSIATTASFNDVFTLNGLTNVASKALTLENGLFIINDASTINLTTGGGDFSIPSTAGLEVRAGTVSVGGADTGILLDGLLRVNGGTVNMDGGAGINNYIEYSASGMATLEVSSGTLTVGSQVRRNLTSTTGVLRYSQSGGVVTVGRRAAPSSSRGVFEVINTGSQFDHTGGSFTMVQGVNSTSVPSLWLEPETSTVTSASTITIGDANTPSGTTSQNIGIKSTVALHNLTIAGANIPIAKLYVVPLTLNGDLLISTSTVLNAMGQGLNIAGNMQVNGAFIASGNTTTFTGTGSISGTTSTLQFYNLSKTGAGTLTQARDIIIDKDLALLGGTLAGSTFTTTLKGNATIDGIFTNTSGTGLNFAGSSTQLLERTVAGTGTLGIVTVDNTSGVRIPDATGYNFTITSGLRLVRGVFDISGSLLTLGVNAPITAVNAFSVANMIQTNSSFTDNGVKKFFPAGTTSDFTFPIGQALYTPVQFVLSSPTYTTGTTVSSIIVRPANEIHPSVIEDLETPNPEIVDVNNVLKYHWIINADNATGFKSDMILQYDQSLVGVTAPYTEADYIAARILSDANPTNIVDKFTTAEVDETANTIALFFNGVTDAGVSGEYFAGIDDAIPDNIRIFTTVRSGNVNEGGAGGVYDALVPGGGAPTGASLIVDTGHTLTFNVSDVSLYRTEIRAGAVLEIPAGSIDHRLGTVVGEGTLRVLSNTSSTVLPAAYYNDFFACTGGSLNYAGAGSYEVMGSITTVRNLIIEGGGTKTLANNDISVCEDFTVTAAAFRNDVNNRDITIGDDLVISGPGVLEYRPGSGTIVISDDLNQTGGAFVGGTSSDITVQSDLLVSGGSFNPGSGGIINIGGNLTYSGGTFAGGSGSLIYSFNGTSPQVITGNFTVSPAPFGRLEINNSSGVTLAGNVSISTRLLLTNGNIYPGTNQLTLQSPTTVVPAEGKSNSFVSGKLYKVLAAGSSFTFPIGKGTQWRTGSINATSATRTWAMEFIVGSAVELEPIVDSFTPTVTAPPILTISSGAYWKISDDASPSTGRVGLSWGLESDVSPNAAERTALKVMVWNDATSSWDSYGGGTFSAGHTQARGTFIAASALSFSEHIVTLGSTEMANPLPVVFRSFTGKTLNGKNYLFLETASEINNRYFVLEHSTDGKEFAEATRLDAKGTPGQGKSYIFIHDTPSPGRNYYRVKQVDLDGQFEYYDKVVVITLDGSSVVADLDFSMFPNPTAKGSVTLQVMKGNDLPVHVKIFDLSGKLITEKDLSIKGDFSEVNLLFGKTIGQGLYLVELSQGYLKKVKRLIVH